MKNTGRKISKLARMVRFVGTLIYLLDALYWYHRVKKIWSRSHHA